MKTGNTFIVYMGDIKVLCQPTIQENGAFSLEFLDTDTYEEPNISSDEEFSLDTLVRCYIAEHGFPKYMHDITVGDDIPQEAYIIHVVSHNRLQYYMRYDNREEALENYLKLCREWYDEENFALFVSSWAGRIDKNDVDAYDAYDAYTSSDAYLDNENAIVTLEKIV